MFETITRTTPWLSPEEQAYVVDKLLQYGLIKFDNARSLPLKSGGKTDVYINLRQARQHPSAITFITELFDLAMRRLKLDQFVEIPDSVSCFAGPLSQLLGIPYLTIRGEAKDGRVSNAKIIGAAQRGQRVAIIDDVITDGASKITPINLCNQLGLLLESLIVLVDRQQGWQKTFFREGLNTPLWAGMTLHDVRKYLISNGIMERCSAANEIANRIIVAYDDRTWDEILPIMDQLRRTGTIIKVNDMVFDQGISNLVPELQVYGRTMVDLKSHDIPNTVGNTCRRLRAHNPWAVTVHASGTGDMVQAAVNALEGTSTIVLAITVLTSVDKQQCKKIYGCTPLTQVLKLARIAWDAGARGFVCSTQEVAALRKAYPDAVLVVPAIRSKTEEQLRAAEETDDQARLGTPKGAINAGASCIVMGRQILGAEDPVAEVHRVLNEELGIQLVA